MNRFTIKQNDTSPAIRAILQDNEGNPIDITGADVRFHMADYRDKEVSINEPATIEDHINGVVSYDWAYEDTMNAGNFKGEFQVSFANGDIETFPNSGYINIKIVAEIA